MREDLLRRWDLRAGEPFVHDSSWVAPVTRSDGSAAVLKIGAKHMEAEDEAEGLRFWNGDPTVLLLEEDRATGALLLERCEPGTPLRASSEPEQDEVIAGMLRRMWREPDQGRTFRPLQAMLAHWTAEALEHRQHWRDAGLTQEGLRLFRDLSSSAPRQVVLATDLHAGNVLRAQREPWLVIDPKPFVGDPAYDATQHLLNCPGRMGEDPLGTIRRMADLLEVDPERVRLWLLARTAAGPGGGWDEGASLALARKLS